MTYLISFTYFSKIVRFWNLEIFDMFETIFDIHARSEYKLTTTNSLTWIMCLDILAYPKTDKWIAYIHICILSFSRNGWFRIIPKPGNWQMGQVLSPEIVNVHNNCWPQKLSLNLFNCVHQSRHANCIFSDMEKKKNPTTRIFFLPLISILVKKQNQRHLCILKKNYPFKGHSYPF